MAVRAGFDGYVQSDTWVPITVTVTNDGDSVNGELRVTVEGFATGSGRVVYTRPIDLPRGSRKQVTLYPADFATFGTSIDIELVEGARVVKTEPVRVQFVPVQSLLIGVLSDTASQGLADIAKVKPSSGETKVATLTTDDLPATGAGWTSLDVLLIADTDTGQLSDEQQTALTEWVRG